MASSLPLSLVEGPIQLNTGGRVADAQEPGPDSVGMISGLFVGFSFGMGGIGAAALAGRRIGRASSPSISSAPCCGGGLALRLPARHRAERWGLMR